MKRSQRILSVAYRVDVSKMIGILDIVLADVVIVEVAQDQEDLLLSQRVLSLHCSVVYEYQTH